jgi:hypothetical protein
LYIGEGTLSFTSLNAAPGDQLREKLPAWVHYSMPTPNGTIIQ